jgi:integrase
MITLSPSRTKESDWKRIPLHRRLVPILEEALKVSAIGTDRVFLLHERGGARPIGLEAAKNPWGRATEALRLPDPKPRLHDLRATWRTNARRSGVSDELQRAIMGHGGRALSSHDRYGRISNDELLEAVDKMSFDFGPTEIYVNRLQAGVNTKC